MTGTEKPIENIHIEMLNRATRMWTSFERRCEYLTQQVIRETSTQLVRYEHLSSDPATRDAEVRALIKDSHNTDRIAANYLAAFDRFTRAATAYGVALQVEQQRQVIELLQRLTTTSAQVSP